MKKPWLIILFVAGLFWFTKRSRLEPQIPPTGTLPPELYGLPPGATIQDSNVFIRNKYTALTAWIPYSQLATYLKGDWILG